MCGDTRIRQFKEDVIKTLDMGEQLNVFKEIVAELEQENALSHEDMAAALCFLAQKERPFPDGKEPERQQRERRDRPDRGDRNDRRGDRRDRGERGERRERREHSNEGMVRYRVDLGREQGVNPGDLVGAIANEGKISGQSIGHIKLFDSCSSVYLPENLAPKVLESLKDARIRNRPMGLKPWGNEAEPADSGDRRSRSRRDGDRKGGRREGGARGERRAPRRENRQD